MSGADARPRGPDEPAGTEVGDALAAALRFVLRSTQNRPQTEAEVAVKLRQRDYAEDTVSAALVEARRQGMVDDAAFAAAWVEDRGRQRGYGVARLRTELARRGVVDADIDAALTLLSDRDDHTAAVGLARTRLRQLPAGLSTEALVRRLGGYLMRRGHSPGLSERAAREVAGADGDWD